MMRPCHRAARREGRAAPSVFALTLALFGALSAGAQTLDFDFDNEAQEARYRELARQLRCLVCQNQSLADSNAALADDLRLELYKQVRSGRTEQQIKRFMTDRYGEFILYMPRFSAGAAPLWLIPLALLLLGGIGLARFSRTRDEPGAGPPATGRSQQVRAQPDDEANRGAQPDDEANRGAQPDDKADGQ